jgi:hypothetical protein
VGILTENREFEFFWPSPCRPRWGVTTGQWAGWVFIITPWFCLALADPANESIHPRYYAWVTGIEVGTRRGPDGWFTKWRQVCWKARPYRYGA